MGKEPQEADYWGWGYGSPRIALELNTNRIVDAIRGHRSLVVREQLVRTDPVIISRDTIRENISPDFMRDEVRDLSDAVRDLATNARNARSASDNRSDFLQISRQLADQSEFLHVDLENIRFGLAELSSSFDWAMDRVFFHLNYIGSTLGEINVAVGEIKDMKKHSLRTEAREYRGNGIYAFNNGFYEEAKDEFLASEKKFVYDPVIHQYLGDIFLRHLGDLGQALVYYQKMARYASAEPFPLALVNWAELHVGHVFYLQGKMPEAVAAAERAVRACDNPESNYHLAHYLSFLAKTPDEVERVVRLLLKVIQKDPGYFVRVDVDHQQFVESFRRLNQPLAELKRQLLNEAGSKAGEVLKNVEVRIKALRSDSNFTTKTKLAFDEAVDECATAIDLYNRGSYFDLLRVLDVYKK